MGASALFPRSKIDPAAIHAIRSADQPIMDINSLAASDKSGKLLVHGSVELALLDKMPVALAIYDAGGGLVHSNPWFQRLICSPLLPCRSAEEHRGWQRATVGGGEIPIDDLPCRRALRGGTVSPGVDLMHVGRDGTGRWFNVSAAPIRETDDDSVLGIVLLCVDAQDAVQAATFAARAGRRFRHFAENSSTAIWIADAASQEFTYRNPLHLALAAHGDGAMRIPDWIGRVAAEDRAAVAHHYAGVLDGRTEQFEYRLSGVAGQGSRRIRETSFPIRDDAGDIVMIGGMASEVTPLDLAKIYLVGGGSGPVHPLRRAIAGTGRKVKMFASLAELLDVAQFLAAGCVIVDLATIGDAETHLPRTLAEHAAGMPIIIIGKAETHAATAVAAMRAGAADYLIPPVPDDALIDALARASGRCRDALATPAPGQSPRDRVARLSKREREVLDGLKSGGTNKSIGRVLGISPRTVELHRSHLMERMNAGSLAELLQATHAADA